MRLTSIEVKKNIGWIIQEKRREKGINQQELCDKAKITQTYLSLVENGKRIPSREVLARIADVLQESAEKLEHQAGMSDYDLDAKLSALVKKLTNGGQKGKLAKLIKFMDEL